MVEDGAFTRFMMKKIINTLDIDVDVAENGQQGCDQLKKNPHDYGLVLMDIHMPVLSGIDATRIIRADPNDPPRNVVILAVTADERYHDKAVVSENGMDGFIAKPITPSELLGLVDRYCN